MGKEEIREVGFRAYHPTLKKMYYDVCVDSKGWSDSSRHFGGDNSTLMQYLGRKDKNGKKIYQVDIIRYYVKERSDFLETSVVELDEYRGVEAWHRGAGFIPKVSIPQKLKL